MNRSSSSNVLMRDPVYEPARITDIAPVPPPRDLGGYAAQRHRRFSFIRYAQCWEDADVLVEALDPQPGQTLLSIASAGDNSLALLAAGPARVIAVDLSPAQLACLELRVAGYRALEHGELLELLGSRASKRRHQLYQRCRFHLCDATRSFWDARPQAIANGVAGSGKFERYFSLFRRWVLPLIHSRKCVAELLQGGSRDERRQFYEQRWDTRRWRFLFRLFFSRTVMGHLGRAPEFFRHVEGQVAARILERVRYGLIELNPAENPYLQWILTGRHTTALPFALRPENFEAIRRNLDRLEWRCQSLESLVESIGSPIFDGCNLSDIFEYLPQECVNSILEKLARSCRPGARLAYWNMLAPRSRPASLARQLVPLTAGADRLFRRDKAFFYSRFVIERVQ